MGLIDVDNFLLKKVQHKLNYWASTKLSLARRKMIVNNIFLSSLWYFPNLEWCLKVDHKKVVGSTSWNRMGVKTLTLGS